MIICGHPVLDGVGVFHVHGSKTLVFIQISVRDFKQHKKLLNIFNTPQGSVPELTNSSCDNYFT